MKRYVILILAVALILLPIQQSSGDIGPKPTITITITGIEEDFYFEVLQLESRDVDPNPGYSQYDIDYYGDVFPEQLIGYQDNDGYASYTIYHCCGYDQTYEGVVDGVHTFTLKYYRPNPFKIALVIKETGTIITSKEIHADYFHATVNWDLTGVDVSESSEGLGMISGRYEKEPFIETFYISVLDFQVQVNFFYRVALTIIIELGILLLFGIKERKLLLLVVAVNIITQLILNIAIIRANELGGAFYYLFMLLLMEGIIFLLEFIAYMVIFRKKLSAGKILLYALLANAASFLIGEYIIARF